MYYSMNSVIEHIGGTEFILIGLLVGILIDVVRDLIPQSDMFQYLLAVAFIIPFSLVITVDFRSGVALYLGTAIGIFAFSRYSK